MPAVAAATPSAIFRPIAAASGSVSGAFRAAKVPASVPPGTPLNMLDLLTHPAGFTRSMVNLDEVGPALLAHLRAEASAHPPLTPRVEAFADELG